MERRFEKAKEAFMKAVFFAQDEALKDRHNQMSVGSKILVSLGRTFNDVSKWDWPKVSKDYQPHITNEEFYAEVHDRVLGSMQPSRFKSKYINIKHPQVLKTNIMVSKMRMKLYEFNGYTSAILSLILLVGAALLSNGIVHTKVATQKYTDKATQAITAVWTMESLSDYFEQVKGYNIDQLKEEAKLVKSGSNNSYKINVLEYLYLKISKKELEDKYNGVEIPDTEKAKLEDMANKINSRLSDIKQAKDEKVLKHEETKETSNEKQK
jgi:hypothetical protein